MPKDNLSKAYEQKLLKLIANYSRGVQAIYYDAIIEVSFMSQFINFNGKQFNLDTYPLVKKKLNELISKMHGQVYSTVVSGIEKTWELSNKKNDKLSDQVIGERKIPSKVKELVYNPNAEALKQFKKRTERGLNLSDRVWNSVTSFRHELEAGLADGIRKGESAAKMATKMKRYLNEPDRLYRRVRNDRGTLQLSRAAKEYNPGQGVYRSSYKNAKRLTITETSMAYRSADHERWQKMAFVKGIEIKLSPQHPKYDICDSLDGIYPKDFKFVGWHPHCLCFATAVQVSDEEFSKMEDVNLGLSKDPVNINYVKDIPPEAKQWISNNSDRIKGWKNQPYWVKDNKGYFDNAVKTGKPTTVKTKTVKPPSANPQPIPKKEFVPAASIAEAEDYAIKNGLANKVSYKGLKDVEIANETNRVLYDLKQKGVSYDNITSLRSIRDAKGKPRFLLANDTQLKFNDAGKLIGEEHTLILNKAFFDQKPTLSSLNEYTKGLRDKNWTAGEKYSDMVTHETGHRLTSKNTYLKRDSSKKETLINDPRLGRYAVKNIDETLAEIYTYYKKTGSAPKAWKDLFNKYSIIKI